MTKDPRSKPVGRLKSMVEVPTVRHREKVEADVFKSASNATQFESVHRKRRIGVVQGTHEDSNPTAFRLENVGRPLLANRARTCVQTKTVNRQVGSEKTLNRPCGFEKSLNKSKLDIASRSEDKLPRRQQVSQENVKGVENNKQRTDQKEECLLNQYSMPVNPIGPSSGSREMTFIRPSVEGRSSQQEESQRRLNHDKQVKDQCHQQKIKGNQQDKKLESVKGKSQPHLKQPPLCREKPAKKTEQGHQAHSRNGSIHNQQSNIDTHEKLPVYSQRARSYIHDKKLGIHDNPPSQQTMVFQCCIEGETNFEEKGSLQMLQYQPREDQEPREGASSQSQRHQSYTSDTQRQYLPERLVSCHEQETKLIQRQQYIQEKVRSRKMLLGSVIPSDMIFSSEACRTWQSMLSYRYRKEKSYKHAVLSADSGVSMGEGSSASRRNSETETDDQAKDDLPTIIAEVGEIVNRRVPSKCQKCHKNRCEMKDASSQHSHPPSEISESPPSSPFTESISSVKIESTAIDVMSPPPCDRIYQCRVIRDKHTYGTMFYPVYRMYLERDGRPEMLLLTARKRKKCSTSKYLICTGNDDLRRKSSSLVGKLRSNLVGTRFHLATYVKGAETEAGDIRPGSPLKFDSLLLFYETNFLGTKGPRRMKVFLPEVGRLDDRLNLLERVRDGSMDGVQTLVNKEPEWDRETLSHILYFEGRVTKSSVKNFQLVEPPVESAVLLQFGKVGRNEFTLDYHPPINAVQAFAIALSSFDGKIACE